ncbi:phosphoribosylamine--glycine ligase [uncultured Peptoniphilus sp.]|uniref:phosphoribosylamine--glycine ligase n=2 Tax=Peptoniphilus TaxID=162289 RepID=UPI0028061697|nr:phosphoribosylamine--glycine ligase [uncultured Peptoniphilus sp.]
MKVLIIGNGGRENALAWKVSKSDKIEKIFMAKGNGGTEDFCTNIDIDPKDLDGLLDFAKKEKIDLTIVGPEDPLCAGIVDKFKEEGLKIFGPNKECAKFEKSKEFTKKFLEKYNIPTAKYKSFKDFEGAKEGLSDFSYPLVIKADGLCLGKGVFICKDKNEGEQALEKIFKDRIFGSEGDLVVMEEFLEGVESSLLCFVSNNKLFPLETAKDHKQIFDGNKGPNTGGVGTYSPGHKFSKKTYEEMEKILRKIEEGFRAENLSYYGILFIGFMISNEMPKVLEFNVRFGDPETEVLMPRIKGDLVDIIEKCLDGNLKKDDIKWTDEVSLTTILCSDGYPLSYQKGKEIKGIEKLDEDIMLFHNGTIKKDGKLYTNGGRVLSVTALGKNLREAREKVYKNIENIDFENKYFRKDIGLILKKRGF